MYVDKKNLLSEICDHQKSIEDHILALQNLLKNFFPKEYNMAYQHYIPQIITALKQDDRWLPRSSYTIEDTISHISDEVFDQDIKSSVKKYL